MIARGKGPYAWGLAILVGAGFGWRHASLPPELVFMDVGQGDCTVFHVGNDAILVDVGPKTPTFDAGDRIVVPKLRAMGLRPRLIFLTHPDTDHVGGIGAVHAAYPAARVAVSKEFRTNKHMLDQLGGAGLTPSMVLWLPRRSRASFGDFSLDLECPEWLEGANDNDGSLVVRLTHGAASAILMGDAGFSVEYRLIPTGGWTSQILKVGHHGSRSGTSTEWVHAVSPTWAVISCGLNNTYGHPAKETMNRLGSVIPLRTDQSGDIRFRERLSGFELEQ